MGNLKRKRSNARGKLQSIAKEILYWTERGDQRDDFSLEDFWEDAKTVLRQLQFTSESKAFARGNFLSAHVEMTANLEALYDVCLTLFPYNQRWSTVRGLEIILTGKDREDKPITARTARTGWEGGITFADLPAGAYQVLLAEDSKVATWQAAQEILDQFYFAEDKEFLQDSTPLVTVRGHKREHLGAVELELSINPHIAAVDMTGFVIRLFGLDNQGCSRRCERTDHYGKVLFQNLCAGEYWFSDQYWVDVPFPLTPAPSSMSLAAKTHTRARLRFPEEADQESPLVYALDETTTGNYVLRVHLRVPLENAPRILYAIMKAPSEKIVTFTWSQEHIVLKGDLPFKRLPQGEWIAQINVASHVMEALSLAAQKNHYCLRIFVDARSIPHGTPIAPVRHSNTIAPPRSNGGYQ